MTILVTAATGHLGRLVLDSLLDDAGVAPEQLRAGARRPERLDAYAERGVAVVPLDYSDPATLAPALDGVDVLLLISGSEVGQRIEQHGAVIDAASAAGVGRVVYTSAPKASTVDWVLAPEHRATEQLIVDSGLPFTFLRNNWYTENYATALEVARDHGVLPTSAGDGRVASASRADYAAAAAAVLTQDGHEGRVYELGGDVAWEFPDLAAALSEVLQRDVALQTLTTEEHVALLSSNGLDQGTAGFVAAMDTAIRDGVLGDADGSLARLIGRPTTPLVEGLRALAS